MNLNIKVTPFQYITSSHRHKWAAAELFLMFHGKQVLPIYIILLGYRIRGEFLFEIQFFDFLYFTQDPHPHL